MRRSSLSIAMSSVRTNCSPLIDSSGAVSLARAVQVAAMAPTTMAMQRNFSRPITAPLRLSVIFGRPDGADRAVLFQISSRSHTHDHDFHVIGDPDRQLEISFAGRARRSIGRSAAACGLPENTTEFCHPFHA